MSSYQVFARKYRPQTFDQVVGQEHITQTLKNAITANRLAHAYLFVGPRGTGKTSTARILAKALNCIHGPTVTPCGECDACREIAAGNSLDVMEIDGASNNGVEQVRELRENVRFAPTHGKYKIYIIDEVHMLTTAAFNALLKTLEEPPEHVKFVFATTDVQKVLPTILSRCQRFDLRRIPAGLIADHLQYIARNEQITLEPEAARAIAKGAEGGLRDAESMLDQLVAFCGETISEADVLSVFGFTASQTVSQLCDHLLDGDAPAALGIVQQQAGAGRDLSRLMADLIGHLRNLLVAKADPEGIQAEVGAEVLATLEAQSERIAMDRLLDLIEQFAAAEGRMKWAPNKKLHFEIAVIKAIQTLGQATLTELLDTLTALKTGGELPSPRQPSSTPSRPAPKPAAARPAPKAEEPAPRRSLVAAFQKSTVPEPAPAKQPEPEPVKAPEPEPVQVPEPEPIAKAPEPEIPAQPPVQPEPEQPAPEQPAPKAEEPAAELAPWDERPAEPAPVRVRADLEAEPAAESEPVRSEPDRPEPGVPHTLSLFGEELFPAPEPPAQVPVVEPEPEPEPEPATPEAIAEPVTDEAAPTAEVEEAAPEPAAEIAPEPVEAIAEAAAPEAIEEPEPVPAEAEAEAPSADPNLWPRVIGFAREKRRLVSSWMELAAFRGIVNGSAVLAFPEDSNAAFARLSLEKPAQIQFLKEAFAQAAGQTVSIRFENLAPGEAVPPVEVPTEAPQPVKDPMEEFQNDPLIRRALDLFKAEIQVG